MLLTRSVGQLRNKFGEPDPFPSGSPSFVYLNPEGLFVRM